MSADRDRSLERLRALDDAFARRGAHAEGREDLRRQLRQRALEQPLRNKLRWWPAVAFAAGAVTMALLVFRGPAPDPGPNPSLAETEIEIEPERVPSTPTPAVQPLAEPEPSSHDDAPQTRPAESPCAAPPPGPLPLEADACAVVDGVRLSAITDAHLEWSEGSIALHDGRAIFDVAPRPDRPLHVTAGDVDVEVVGTRFVMLRDGAQGWISMLEGHVRVRIGDQEARDLRDDARLEWNTAAPPDRSEPRPRPPRADTRSTDPSDEGLAELLDEVAALRRRGAYREAVERLESGARSSWSRRGRELVSYEIGTLLERQLGDVEAACTHWSAHRQRFPGGRYDELLARRAARLGCD